MRKLIVLFVLLIAGNGLAKEGEMLTMWQVDGVTNSIFILGSVHLLRAEDHPLPSRIEEAYEEAESIIMEIDMDDLDPVAMQAMVNRLGMLNDGRTLRDLMGDDLYDEALAAAAKMDIPLEMLARTEPWLAAVTIEQMALSRIGFNPAFGVEMHVMTKAGADNKPIEGLETIDEQLAFLDGLSLDAQRDMLMQTLAEGLDIESMMDSLIEAWRNGDIEFFESTVLKDIRAFPELYRAIVSDRNARWATEIRQLLDDEDDYLIVVGALHLVGPDGVPTLLENQGEQVRQLQQ